MAALTVVTKISPMHVITAMAAGAGFAEFDTTGKRACVAGFTLNVEVRTVELKASLSVVIEFPK
jgi:hypothetical protein